MTSPQLDGLFTPFAASSLKLRNRFAMAPMTRQKSPGGIPDEENVEYYRKRAAGGVGLIITEGTYVNAPAAGPSSDVPRFYGDASAAGWAEVAKAVHAEGAAIIPQLWHTGVARGADVEFEPDLTSVSPSGVDVFHASTRRHWVPSFETAGTDPIGLAGWTKKVTGLPAITVGSVGVDSVFLSESQAVPGSTRDRLDILRNQFEREEFDVVALGRALLADAAWVDKTQSGRFDDNVPFRKAA